MEIERIRERAYKGGLSKPWHAFEQRMTSRDNADQNVPHDLELPDHDLADFVFDALCGLSKLADSEFGALQWTFLPDFSKSCYRNRRATKTSVIRNMKTIPPQAIAETALSLTWLLWPPAQSSPLPLRKVAVLQVESGFVRSS